MKLGLLLVFLLYPRLLFAHSYKLDAYGCHNNGSLNVYECHSGAMTGKSWPNPGGKEAMIATLTITPPRVTVSGHRLDWIQTAPPEVTGFRLWWKVDQTWHGPIEMGRLTSYTLPDILAKATYTFVIAAYNSAGESPKSNEATLTVP